MSIFSAMAEMSWAHVGVNMLGITQLHPHYYCEYFIFFFFFTYRNLSNSEWIKKSELEERIIENISEEQVTVGCIPDESLTLITV